MNSSMSKTKESMTTRLAEIHMSAHERLRAAAHLERAEAMADGLVWLCNGVSRLFRLVFARPARTVSNAG
jgi:hypothetical protein